MQTNDKSKMVQILKHCVIKNKKPTKIWFEVTDSCNSRCSTCNIWKKKPTENPLTPTEIFNVFSDPFLSEVNDVNFSGGEPMVRRDIKDCILSVHKALPNAHINLSTNGMMPWTTYRVVSELLAEGVTDLSLGTSIDAIGTKNDSIRGVKKAWWNVKGTIELCKKLRNVYPGFSIGFGTVLQRENEDLIPEIIKFAEENNLFYLIQWLNESDFYGDCKVKKCDRSKEREIVSKLPDRFNMIRELWLRKLNHKSIKFKCYALKDFFVLKCNGDVAPCLTHWDHVVGNVRDEGIEHILTRSMRTYKKRKYLVSKCDGCLNSWGTFWSWEADGWPYLKYYLSHPVKLWRKLK